jgi:hypothetical protein
MGGGEGLTMALAGLLAELCDRETGKGGAPGLGGRFGNLDLRPSGGDTAIAYCASSGVVNDENCIWSQPFIFKILKLYAKALKYKFFFLEYLKLAISQFKIPYIIGYAKKTKFNKV